MQAIVSEVASAQETGTVRGTVYDALTDQPVAGASVRVLETGREAVTDADGTYSLEEVPIGSRRIEASGSGFESAVQIVSIESGATAQSDFAFLPAEGEVLEIETVGERPTSTRTAAIEERIEGSSIGDYVSQEEIDLIDASEGSDVVQKMPGATIKGGKFAVIRGLQERYSQTLFNHATVPSPQPDRREVPLDLFPAAIIKSVAVVKSYSPELPGEFSGGSVQIASVDVPEEDFLKLGFSLEYVDGTTFRDFQTYQGGNIDLFGFDDGTRDLPDAVPRDAVRPGGLGRGLTEEEVQAIGRSFPNIWNIQTTSAPPGHEFSMSFGKAFGQPGAGSLGIMGAFSWENDYQTIRDETFRVLLNFGDEENPDPRIANNFTLNSSVFETKMTGFLSLVYEMSEAQKVGVKNLYTRGSEDLTRFQEGFEFQQTSLVEITRLRYTERSLLSSQLFGEHLLLGDTFLRWRANYALSQRDIPDDRGVRYDFEDSLQDFRYQDISGSGSRDFFILDENIFDVGADYQIPLSLLPLPLLVEPDPDPDEIEPDQKIQIGGSWIFRNRDFDSRRFRFIPQGMPVDEFGNPIDLTASPEDLFERRNINPEGFELQETTRPTDNYDAEWTILSAYGFVDLRLLETLRLQTGARVEHSLQEVNTFALFGGASVDAELKGTDVLPAANLIWEFHEVTDPLDPEAAYRDMQLRLSASRTVTRPEFRELAEFEFTDVAGGFAARGNPDLERTRILNLDLRWDWFPAPRDVVSASVFYKRFDEPIEVVILPTGSSLLTTWQNADTADLYGFELEAKKNLGFLTPDLTDFSLFSNFTYLESEVRLKEENLAVQTNETRALQGQPEFILNLGLVYESSAKSGILQGITAGVFANTFGERITAVGAFGVPDVVEQPRWNLDASISKSFGRSTLKISAENILDDEFEFKQGNTTSREFSLGFSVGVSYSYRF